MRSSFSAQPTQPMALENELQVTLSNVMSLPHCDNVTLAPKVSPYIMKVLEDGKDQKAGDASVSGQRVLQVASSKTSALNSS